MSIAKNIKAIIAMKGITLKHLSSLSGVSVNTLYSITKRDSKNVNTNTLKRIATALNIPTSELLYSEEYDLGQTIKINRKQRKMTQSQLAEAIGKKEATIRKYENGDIEPPLSVLQDLSIIFGVSLLNLLNNSDDWLKRVPTEILLQEIQRRCDGGG